MRLIDADKLKAHYSWWSNEEQRMFDQIVDAQPTVETVVHGEWLGTEYDGYADGNPVYVEFACSACGHLIDTDEGDRFTRYRPNCGAKMDGGLKHETNQQR